MATGKYLFRVHPKATKTEIALAITDAFKVDVVSVNTMHVRGKERRRGRTHGFQSNWKKAVVTLAEGQKVQFTVTQGKKGPQAENVVVLS